MDLPSLVTPVNTRKNQHKFTTPPWKETYKKRCLENLRKSRQNFLNRFRTPQKTKVESVVQEVMTEEWNELRKSHSSLPACTEFIFATDDEEINYLNSIIGEIEVALRTEEDYLLELYYQDYEKELCGAVDQLLTDTDSVICPVCQRNRLLMNKGVVICHCGLRINTEQDALTLPYIKQCINKTMTEHNSMCEHTATFSMSNALGMDHLLLTCEACDFMYIVI